MLKEHNINTKKVKLKQHYLRIPLSMKNKFSFWTTLKGLLGTNFQKSEDQSIKYYISLLCFLKYRTNQVNGQMIS